MLHNLKKETPNSILTVPSMLDIYNTLLGCPLLLSESCKKKKKPLIDI